MTNEEIKAEFCRWIDAGKPDIWFNNNDDEWRTIGNVSWHNTATYIVDDKHTELRMLQIDKPETKFEIYYAPSDEWFKAAEPSWSIKNEYRVSLELEVDTKVIVWGNNIQKFKRYFSHFEDGVIYCFANGSTQYSNNGRIIGWNNWELEDEEV